MIIDALKYAATLCEAQAESLDRESFRVFGNEKECRDNHIAQAAYQWRVYANDLGEFLRGAGPQLPMPELRSLIQKWRYLSRDVDGVCFDPTADSCADDLEAVIGVPDS